METLITQVQQTSLVEWLGTATGLAGVALSIKEKALAWPLFILCYALYTVLSFGAGFYAAMALNACFIPISAYGWWKWSKGSGSTEGGLVIGRLRGRALWLSLAAVFGGTVLLGLALQRFVQGSLPYLDAFATTLSFVAQWLLSRKYLENWIAWLLADVAFIVLWGVQGYWVSVVMFVVFTALAAIGFASWKKELAKREG